MSRFLKARQGNVTNDSPLVTVERVMSNYIPDEYRADREAIDTHRGVLAGLSEDERAARVSQLHKDKRIDFDSCSKDERACLVAQSCALLFGIATLNQCYEQYTALVGPHDSVLSRDSFEQALRADMQEEFEFLAHNDDNYLIHPALSDNEPRLRGLEGDKLKKAQDFVGQYREQLIDAHLKLTPRKLEPAMFEQDTLSWMCRQHSARLLRNYLDEHIPNGADDLSFADNLVRRLVKAVALHQVDLDGAYDMVCELSEQNLGHRRGVRQELVMHQVLQRLVQNLYDAVPLWEYFGLSRQELSERRLGKRSFFDAEGNELQIGRNDPCPCGSGKKYKKCCGR